MLDYFHLSSGMQLIIHVITLGAFYQNCCWSYNMGEYLLIEAEWRIYESAI